MIHALSFDFACRVASLVLANHHRCCICSQIFQYMIIIFEISMKCVYYEVLIAHIIIIGLIHIELFGVNNNGMSIKYCISGVDARHKIIDLIPL